MPTTEVITDDTNSRTWTTKTIVRDDEGNIICTTIDYDNGTRLLGEVIAFYGHATEK